MAIDIKVNGSWAPDGFVISCQPFWLAGRLIEREREIRRNQLQRLAAAPDVDISKA